MFSIRLEKLRTIDWSLDWDINGGQVVLECPELQALAIDWGKEEAPILNCPKLKHLKYADYRDWVAKLDSLEVLNLVELKTNSEGILRNHPKLHTLNLFDVDKAVVKEIIRSKRRLGRADLRIFCRSLPVESDDVLNEFDQIFEGVRLRSNSFDVIYKVKPSFTAKEAEFYSKYEHEFRDDFFVFCKHPYGTFFTLNDNTFADFKLMADRTSVLRKTHRVKILKVQAGQSFGQDELIDLLKKMPHLNHLQLFDVSFDQNFFDQLPSFLPFLQCLEIYSNKKPLTCCNITDLSFILRFQELITFIPIYRNFSPEELLLLEAFDTEHYDFGNGKVVQYR